MNLIDLTGNKYGKLTVIERAENKGRHTQWKCICECGKTSIVSSDNLRNGHTTSCGCNRHRPSPRRDNLIGQIFGEWTVISRGEKMSYWLCECSCGIRREVYGPSLKNAKSLSCGHLFKNDIRKPIIGNRYGNLVVIDQFKSEEKWYCHCQCDCGNMATIERRNLISGNTQSCGCIISKGEARIKKILQENHIPFISQWTPEDISNRKYKYDFFVDNKYVIEFDGPQHDGAVGGYYTEEKVKALMLRDKEKNQYCFDHKIPIYRIPYELRDSVCLQDLTDKKYEIKEVDDAEV